MKKILSITAMCFLLVASWYYYARQYSIYNNDEHVALARKMAEMMPVPDSTRLLGYKSAVVTYQGDRACSVVVAIGYATKQNEKEVVRFYDERNYPSGPTWDTTLFVYVVGADMHVDDRGPDKKWVEEFATRGVDKDETMFVIFNRTFIKESEDTLDPRCR